MKLFYFDEQINNKLNIEILNKEDILAFINGFLKYLNIESYLKETKFLDFDNKNDLAYYDWDNLILKIDYDNLIKDADVLYEGEDKTDYVLFINVMILLSLVHEITHIYQNAHRYDGTIITNIINSNLNLFDILEKKEYDEYWSLFLVERDAIVTSYEYIIILLKTIIKNERMYHYFLEELADNLTCGYRVRLKEITSPLQIVNKRFSKSVNPKLSKYDIYDSLKYGFPITKKEYLDFRKEKEKIILLKNNLQG